MDVNIVVDVPMLRTAEEGKLRLPLMRYNQAGKPLILRRPLDMIDDDDINRPVWERTRGLARCVPRPTSNEKGIRNFIDAARQSP